MSVRISSGLYQNRELETPEDFRENSPVRPTKARVREAMVNMLVARCHLNKCHVIDLFCGSGALGLEALSRGAKEVTFVDADCTWVRKNIEKLNIKNAEAMQTDALRYTCEPKADIIFVDPPYGMELLNPILENREQYGQAESLWVLELERTNTLQIDETHFFILKKKKYGKSMVVLLEQK